MASNAVELERVPLIAVTGRVYALGRIERVLEPQVAVSGYYLEAITRAGGVGAVLAPQPFAAGPGAVATMAGFDGLLITGGVDVDPSLYGQEPDVHTYGCDPVLDRFDMELLAAAVNADKAVLAVCRGLQLMNVWRGGTLDQHITGRPGLVSHGMPAGGGGSSVSFSITPGSRLAQALDADRARGRCHHHQAVGEVGSGLTAVARADDGITEGLELDGPGWVVGVQWHPEDSAASDPVQQRLFDRFLVEAGSNKRSTERSGDHRGEPLSRAPGQA